MQRAAPAQSRRACISEMRSMGPDDSFRLPALTTEMRNECIERLDHVVVAQVPRRYVFEKHRAVVLFGVLDQSCILLCVEEFILGDATVAPRVFGGPTSQFDELPDDCIPARFAAIGGGDETVDLRV